MIFRNTFRLLLTNFSNVWKVLLYYLICIVITFGVCYSIASPIIVKLQEANVFNDLFNLLNSFFSKPSGVIRSFSEILQTASNVISYNIQFKFNYIFLIVWIVFVFPFTLDLAQLAMGEVLYGFMTSQVKYGFTGRFIKNIGKSCVYSLVRYFVLLPINLIICGIGWGIVKLATSGSIAYILLNFVLFVVLLCVLAFKQTIFSCWMPAIAVLNINPFKALKKNFACAFRRFFSIFSNALTLILTAFVVNVIFCVFSFSVSLIITLPLTAFVFVIFQMVSYFSSQGMRFYVYPDMFISPKKFEEQDKFKKLKYLV